MNPCKLFCVPHAGGSSLVFSDWKDLIAPGIEIIPIELNGRGQLRSQPFYASIREAAEDIVQKLENHLNERTPYSFFGQSLGGLILFETLYLLKQLSLPLPFHVFFSAIFPPHINKIRHKLHELSDADFIKHLKKWSSLSKSPEWNAEWMDLLVPILKSDYKLLENYHFSPSTNRFSIDFTILKGRSDHWLTADEYREWDKYSNRAIHFYEIDGGHLFVQEKKEEVVSIVNATIEGYF